MSYNIKRNVEAGYIPLSDAVELRLDFEAGILSPNESIRYMLRDLIANMVISPKSCYTPKGIDIYWNDGNISATTETGIEGLNWLKATIWGTQ